MYLFFDTETNGFKKKGADDMRNIAAFPRIIQLAFIVTDVQFNEVFSFNSLIKPDGWSIPSTSEYIRLGHSAEKAYKKAKFWHDHGYSTMNNIAYGIPATQALLEMARYINGCSHLFAHNMAFDYPVVGSEMIRYGIKCETRPSRICTMNESKQFVQATDKNGRLKAPNLAELHFKLFGVNFDGAHDALADVSATVRCARELSRLGVLKIH